MTEDKQIIVDKEEYDGLIEKALYLKHLEQENKELKEDVLKWQKEFSRQYQINENKGYSKTEEKYRSALEEIRKLIVIGVNASQCNCGLRALADDILNKINEVLK